MSRSSHNIGRHNWQKYIEAVRKNDIDSVKQYIQCGGDLNHPTTPQGAVHCAVYFEYMDLLKLLLDAGINVNQPDEDGDTALHYAVGQTKNIECIRLLLKHGACPFLQHYSAAKLTPIDVARRLDDKQIIELLTEHGDLVKRLCKAAEEGNTEMVDNLLTTTGVNVNALSDEFVNPLHEASLAARLPVVKLLIQFHADINAKTASETMRYNTPLHCAASKGHLDIVQYLIEQGARKDSVNSNLHTPLLCAIILERVDVAECLIKAGCDIHVQDTVEKTPLHWAAFFGLNDIVTLLLEYGADIDALADFGQTPLHCATGHPFPSQTIRLLIEKGADVTIINDMGLTILDYCLNNKPEDVELIELIKKHGG